MSDFRIITACLGFFTLICFQGEASVEVENGDDETVTDETENQSKEPVDVFYPTDQWQTVKEGGFANEWEHNKTNKMTVQPVKIQINLGICPVWSVLAVCVMGS